MFLAIFFVLMCLKLGSVINWSWWVICAPIFVHACLGDGPQSSFVKIVLNKNEESE